MQMARQVGNDWTSLLGTDKKILLEASPDKLKTCLHPQTSDAVVKVWKGFGHIYGIVNHWAPDKDPNDFFTQAKEWISDFLMLNGKSEGYERRRITPYMHIMVTHIPKFLEMYKTLKIFTGQGVERHNDMARGVIVRKSNKWDSAGDVLHQEQRQWNLQNHEREARSYEKRKSTTRMRKSNKPDKKSAKVSLTNNQVKLKLNRTLHNQQPQLILTFPKCQ